MKRILLALLAVMSCAVYAATQSRLPQTDTQSWNDFQLTVPMSKKVDFLTQLTLRFGDNITTPVDERYGLGFNYKLNKYVTVNESVFGRDARPLRGRRKEHELRLTFGATLQHTLNKYTVTDRNWFERRWREPQVDAWRYRNRLRVEHPFHINKTKFNWFVADEVFYDWSLNDWVRNRAQIGANHPFNKHFTLELYYMRQNDGRSRPGDLHILGSVWRLKL